MEEVRGTRVRMRGQSVEDEQEVEEEVKVKEDEDLKQEENVLKEKDDQICQMKFVDHVINHGLTLREAGLRVQPNLCRFTAASGTMCQSTALLWCRTSFNTIQSLQYCTFHHILHF
ncbi:hypothetical protein XENORESO_019306 [Xenotaenia resolanae]|uniref:Uncharacterized protein n=1 Tax=Xenotaenia resolanae TaxID=208358 RepID=A0ABV0XAU7_9TELE